MSETNRLDCNEVVLPVATTGDCMMLSSDTSTLEFCCVAVKVCSVPIPTEVKSSVFGVGNRASDADADTLISRSLIFTT